jgi:hypothetical protein
MIPNRTHAHFSDALANRHFSEVRQHQEGHICTRTIIDSSRSTPCRRCPGSVATETGNLKQGDRSWPRLQDGSAVALYPCESLDTARDQSIPCSTPSRNQAGKIVGLLYCSITSPLIPQKAIAYSKEQAGYR